MRQVLQLFQDRYASFTGDGKSRTCSQVRPCMSVIVVSLVRHPFYWLCLFRWSCPPFRLPGFQRESRAWAVMAVRNTSWLAMLLPFQVELNSMRVKLRLTVACGSASYLNASLLM